MSLSDSPRPAVDPPVDAAEREVLRALRGIRFGSIEVVVHDGRVVQIERREKLRPGAIGKT